MNYYLKVLLTPACWIQNYRFSLAWDKALNAALDEFEFSQIDEHEAQLGPYKVWIANHPYASFTLEPPRVRPRRKTILKAFDRLIESKLKALAPPSQQSD